jgi:hypothetical protein
MTEAEVLTVLRRHFESLFPKTCVTCGRRYATLREYILMTKRLGSAKSYDADLGDWQTTSPIGSLAYADCSCGSTLALTTEGLALSQRQALLTWVKGETERRHVTPSALLDRLRDAIRAQVLSDKPPGAPDRPASK